MNTDSSAPGSSDRAARPERRTRGLLALALLAMILAGVWVLWSAGIRRDFDGRGGITPLLAVSTRFPPDGRLSGDAYIGTQTCAECHPGEYVLFTGSGHARTFRPAASRVIAQQLAGKEVVDPERPGVKWSYSLRDGQFHIRRQEAGKIEQFVADYALGSGHHATTFVTVLDLYPARFLEHRLTHYAKDDTLKITPGQDSASPAPGTTPHGRELSHRDSRKCFTCHTTQLSAHPGVDVDPPTLIPAVTCERCHGPGRGHVEAARDLTATEEIDLSMPMGRGRWTVQSQLTLCGDCHRHPSRVPTSRLDPDDPVLARFQPVGLSQSRCFQGSGGRMTCVTCHDPHARASSDPVFYENACLQCHAPSSPDLAPAITGEPPPGPSPPCPVSPTSGCISCHMPGIDSGQHILFTDHWIRVRDSRSGP